MFSASLTGNFAGLTAIGKRVAGLANPAFARALNKEFADEALFQVQAGFAQQRDPYGAPWFPKVFDDGRKILRGKSGRLERSFFRRYLGPDATIIGTNNPEARFQGGTGIYGPSGRRIYPKGRALRIPGAGRGGKNGAMFFRSIAGARPRLMVPQQWRPSQLWNRALRARASAYILSRVR